MDNGTDVGELTEGLVGKVSEMGPCDERDQEIARVVRKAYALGMDAREQHTIYRDAQGADMDFVKMAAHLIADEDDKCDAAEAETVANGLREAYSKGALSAAPVHGSGWQDPGKGIPCFIGTGERCMGCGKHIGQHYGMNQYRCLPRDESEGASVDDNHAVGVLLGKVPVGQLKAIDGFEKMGWDLGKLVDAKQRAYGDSVGKTGPIMRVLYPDGIPPEAVDDALLIVRVLDKLNRMASNPKGDLLGESPWRDCGGYALLGMAQHEKRHIEDLRKEAEQEDSDV